MNGDDDIFLSEYLDGQLEPEQVHLVESALVSNPELAEKLRGLTSLRDLVASLNRDFPIDVTARVIGRTRMKGAARARDLRPLGWLRMVNWSPRAALAAGIAASLLLSIALAATLILYRADSGRFRPLAQRMPAPHPVLHDAAVESALRSAPGDLASPESGATTEAALASATGEAARGASAEASHRLRAADNAHILEQYHQLLDHPNRRRVFRISDGGDAKVLQQVASVVESTTRFGFYKITISQGIVIDPRHPEQATVYAALVSARDMDTLRDGLARALPDRVDESPAEPAVMTQLADIAQVHVFRSAPFGDVLIPQEGLALQTDREPVTTPSDETNLTAPDQPTIEQERSAPIGEEVAKRLTTKPDSARPSAAAHKSGGASLAKTSVEQGATTEIAVRAAGARAQSGAAAMIRRRETPEETFVVLVWVARSHHG
jgi:hypothetical protein